MHTLKSSPRSWDTLFLHGHLFLRSLIAPTVLGACGLVECDGKIVLVRQSYTHGWHLPGGGIKRGEAPEAAVLRELREEIGLKTSRPPQLFGVYNRCVGLVGNLNLVYYIGEAVFDFKPNLEIREVRLVDPQAPLPPDVGRGARNRIKELVGKKAHTSTWE